MHIFFSVLSSSQGNATYAWYLSQCDQLQCIESQQRSREGTVRDRVMVQVRNVPEYLELVAFSKPPSMSNIDGKVLQEMD